MAVLGFANAATVSIEKAQAIAVNFFKVTRPGNNNAITATLKYSYNEDDNTVDFYVFEISPAPGFVIVAGNDNTIPVIGYSTESSFSLDTTHHTGITYWMKHVAGRIHQSVVRNVTADARISYLWNAYLNGQNPNTLRSSAVAPLLTTTWDQSPNYNALCPYNTTDAQRTVTGCVATAMAQIMKYWAYPTRGTGSFSYTDAPPQYTGNYGLQSANFDTVFNWAAMPASISSANSAIALLMYDCGVSVAMDYGDNNQGGSGAWVLQVEAGAGQPCSQYSYVNYFYYNPNTIQGVVKSDYTETDWINLMENELNNNRVIQYEGDDVNGGGGHTWVCDGYDASNNLHMNWGWSGQDNGYFAVSNLNASPYLFNDNEAALIGIEPISPVNVTASAISQTICPGSTTTLTAQGPASATYLWQPTTGLSCPTCATTTVTPGSTTLYTVTADSAGVKGSATTARAVMQAAAAGLCVPATSSCAVPANIPFGNTSRNATSYLWDFGDGANDTSANPVHVYNGYGTYTVKLSSYNNCSGDSLTRSQIVHITDQAPVIAGQSICAGHTAMLTANGAGNISWYDAPGGHLIDTGSSYVTPALNNSTTYYVSSVIAAPANTAAPATNALGGGGYFTNTNEHGEIFNCTVPQTLKTVDVYSQSAANRVISLEDSTGTVITADTVYVMSGHSTIILNMDIPIGNNLKLAMGGITYLYRNNSGASYPYTSSDGTIVLTNSDAGTAGYYYYFYNWKLQQPGCTTNTVAVPVTVLGGAGGSFSDSLSGTTVSFTPNPGITNCTWSFGDGATSTQLNATHNYSSYGNYSVTLIESNGSCTDTITQLVSLNAAGINNAGSFETLSLFPDPANNVLNVKINTTAEGNTWQLIAYNVLGEQVLQREVQLQKGSNVVTLDVSALSSGVHILSLQSGAIRINRRFVKAN